MSGPLAGIRVVDMTAVLLGPIATQTLGDLGADVVKVEPPEGDITRSIVPSRHRGMGSGFLNFNRNKRSVVLDLKQPAARAALGRLIDGADVFIHSMRAQAMDRIGFGPEAALARNPRLIYCAAYGYARAGRHGWRPAYDDIIQGVSGLAALQAQVAGEPRYVATAMIDKLVGVTVVGAVNAALFHRERSGEGQAIEVPMFETAVAFLLPEHLAGRTFEPQEGEVGYARMMAPYRRPYRAKEGHICVLPYNAAQWGRFFAASGRPEMASDPLVTDGETRSRRIAELYAMVAEIMPERTAAEWQAVLDAADVPAMVVNDLDQVIDDAHLAEVGLFQRHLHDSEGELRLIGHPVNYSRTPAETRRLPPRLGQHTAEVLAEAGLGADEIARMVASGAAAGEG